MRRSTRGFSWALRQLVQGGCNELEYVATPGLRRNSWLVTIPLGGVDKKSLTGTWAQGTAIWCFCRGFDGRETMRDLEQVPDS